MTANVSCGRSSHVVSYCPFHLSVSLRSSSRRPFLSYRQFFSSFPPSSDFSFPQLACKWKWPCITVSCQCNTVWVKVLRSVRTHLTTNRWNVLCGVSGTSCKTKPGACSFSPEYLKHHEINEELVNQMFSCSHNVNKKFLFPVCVCVCVCVRERERDRQKY